MIPPIDRVTELSSIPARWIDEAFLEEPGFVFSKMAWGFKIQCYNLMLDLLLAISAIASLLAAIASVLCILITSDDTQKAHLAALQVYATRFSKNMMGLFAACCLLNILFPQNFSLLFLIERDDPGIRNGGKDILAADVEIKRPEHCVELQALVREANRSGHILMPLGGGRSQGLQFIPVNSGQKRIVIDMSCFNTIEIDDQAKTAKVGAGVLWSKVQEQANKSKLAICSAQASLSIFTVGGSLGIDAHGWDIKNGMLSQTIESLTIVTPRGNLETITPHDEAFSYITGGLGLVGIVVSATVKLTDNIKVKRTTREVTPDEFNTYFSTLQTDNHPTVLSLARLELGGNPLARIFMENYERLEEDSTAYVSPGLEMEAEQGNRLDRILIALLRTFDWVKKLYWERERALFQQSEPVLTRNEAMHFGIRSMYNYSVSQAEWLQEYFIPRQQIASFLKGLGLILKENHVPLMNATIRYVPRKEGALSYAPADERFAVVICFNQHLNKKAIRATKRWQRQAHQLTVDHGGSIYLAYQNNISFDNFDRSYPNHAGFSEYKKKVDPNGVLQSGFFKKYLAPREINHTKYVMEHDKEAFKGFLNSILYRVDAEPLYALLDDILTYCDTHEEIYEELCDRLPEIRPNVLTDIYRTLQSLYAIKKDLGAQAAPYLKDKTNIEGVLEIGSPGRFIDDYQQHGIRITGPIYASDEQETFLSRFPAPTYDHFIPLNFNDPSSFTAVPDQSVELITCYVGLHHMTEEVLNQFLIQMRRILKPKGRFLLVDHDISNDNVNAMAHLAHIVFNAVTKVSLQEERREIRNFQPIDYWVEKLAKYQLTPSQVPVNEEMIRENDPTCNRMICLS